MVQSNAPTVDAWFDTVEPKRAPWLEKVRASALHNLPGFTEDMRYGMPSYANGGDPVFAFNSQKNHISLYVNPRVHALHAEALKGVDCGKSCIRYRRGEQIDFQLLDRMLADTARLDITSVC